MSHHPIVKASCIGLRGDAMLVLECISIRAADAFRIIECTGVSTLDDR